MNSEPEDFQGEFERFEKYFTFRSDSHMLVRALPARTFQTKMCASDSTGIFLRPITDESRLIFLPWSQIVSMEAIVLVDDDA